MEEADGIEIQGQHYLLLEVGGGNAVHLAPSSGGSQGDRGTEHSAGASQIGSLIQAAFRAAAVVSQA